MAPIGNVRDKNSNSNRNSRGSHLRRSIQEANPSAPWDAGRMGWRRVEWVRNSFSSSCHVQITYSSKKFRQLFTISTKDTRHDMRWTELGTGVWKWVWVWVRVRVWVWVWGSVDGGLKLGTDRTDLNLEPSFRYSYSSGLRSPSVPATVPADTCWLSGCRARDLRSSGILPVYINAVYEMYWHCLKL